MSTVTFRGFLMAFVPPYVCDIFVSYAHVDDRPAPGTNTGWVTTLVQGLTWYLAQKLGRSDAFTLWMDHELAGNVPLTPEITAKLHNSATMVLIWSPGYVASAWCQRELDTFLGRLREQPHVRSNVFIVERGPRAQEQQPSALQDLLGYKFWAVDRPGRPPSILGSPQPNPADTRYYDLLNDLSTDLAETLQRLKNAATREQELEGTVFLAEVTDDLDSQRDEVRRYLVQAGLHVVPDTWYSREPSAFQ
jgi:TIR domain